MRVEMQVDIKYSSNYYDEEKDICNEVKTVYPSSFLEKFVYSNFEHNRPFLLREYSKVFIHETLTKEKYCFSIFIIA